MAVFGWLVLVAISVYVSFVCAFIALFGGEEFSGAKGLGALFVIIIPILLWWLVIYTSPFTLTLL